LGRVVWIHDIVFGWLGLESSAGTDEICGNHHDNDDEQQAAQQGAEEEKREHGES
jgi:hypothetical protein